MDNNYSNNQQGNSQPPTYGQQPQSNPPPYQQSQGPTKQCKYCKTAIPKAAKICPNCRKKQSKKVLWIILIVIFLFVGCVSVLGENESDSPKQITATPESTVSESQPEEISTPAAKEEKTEFNIGETVDLKGVAATLVSVDESTGSEYNKPTEGNIFVFLEFEIANNSDKEIVVSSMMSFEAYCDDYSVSQSIMGLVERNDKNQLDGNVAAGKKMNGIIAYEVPVDWKQMEVSFTPDFWSGRDIKFIAVK